MRLATIDTPDGPRAAVVRDGGAVVVNGYEDVGALLREGGVDAARDAGGRPLADPVFLRPVLAPGAVVCVGLNYRTHILEMGGELPSEPTLFSKLPRALTDAFAEISLPGEHADYEGELAVVIGASGRDIAVCDAWDHVAGLTVLNDVTARDYQRRTPQWFAGKTFEASTPIGPWIVTPDELPADAELRVTVNGEERQRASLSDLVFDVPSLVADLSPIVELQPGDVIATGTPGGVGEPGGRFLRDGDVVEVAIDGIGSIRNVFRA
jgi:acylpyruvate hydrolase